MCFVRVRVFVFYDVLLLSVVTRCYHRKGFQADQPMVTVRFSGPLLLIAASLDVDRLRTLST